MNSERFYTFAVETIHVRGRELPQEGPFVVRLGELFRTTILAGSSLFRVLLGHRFGGGF
jgi:hypothetical protein